MSVDLVCLATLRAIVLALSSVKALFRIFTFIVSALSSCRSISASVSCEIPFFPIQIVGFSELGSRFIWRFVLGRLMTYSFP